MKALESSYDRGSIR